jgi:hypothetical protein
MKRIKLPSTDYYTFVSIAKHEHIYIGVVGGFVIIHANVLDLVALGYLG